MALGTAYFLMVASLKVDLHCIKGERITLHGVGMKLLWEVEIGIYATGIKCVPPHTRGAQNKRNHFVSNKRISRTN